MGRGHQHHPPFRNRASGLRLQLGADLIDHDHLRHVVFHRLDHHLMLKLRPGHLHTPRTPDGGMGDISVASNFIAGVNHHHPFFQLIGQNAGDLAKGRGLPHAGDILNQHVPLSDERKGHQVNDARLSLDRSTDIRGERGEVVGESGTGAMVSARYLAAR